MGPGWKVSIKLGQGMGIGLFLDSEALGVTAGTPRPCLSSPGNNVGFFGPRKYRKLGRGKWKKRWSVKVTSVIF